MKSLLAILFPLVLPAACTRAAFEPIPGLDAPVCEAPTKPSCEVILESGLCDPVCQAGSCGWCDQKCTKNVSGQTVCGAVLGQKKTFQSCNTPNGSGDDECEPGNICLIPEGGSSSSFCFALCRSLAECREGAACGPRKTIESGATVNVCDPPSTSCAPDSPSPCCNPTDPQSLGCPGDQFCYLIAADGQTGDSRTVCEFSTGEESAGRSCTTSRECSHTLACIGGFCRKVCDRARPDACPVDTQCRPEGGRQYGVCY